MDPVQYTTYKGMLKPEYWSSAPTRNIYKAICKLQESGPGHLDFDVLGTALQQAGHTGQDYDYILEVMGGQDAAATGLRAVVVRHVQTQMLLAVGEEIGRFASGAPCDLHTLSAQVAEAADFDLVQGVVVDYGTHAGVYDDGALAAGAVPLGFALVVDEYFKGGIAPGELLSFLSWPGGGKTTFLINSGAGAFLARRRVLHVTTEIHAPRVASRYDLALAPFCPVGEDFKTFVKGLTDEGSRLWIKDVSDTAVTPAALESFIRRELPDRPHVLVVDYADELLSSRKYEEKRHELALVYKELRQLGARLGIPVFTATQATREALRRRQAELEDVAESFGIARVADHLLSINTQEGERGVHLKVIKSRRRSSRPMWLMDVDYDNCVISDSLAGGTTGVGVRGGPRAGHDGSGGTGRGLESQSVAGMDKQADGPHPAASTGDGL